MTGIYLGGLLPSALLPYAGGNIIVACTLAAVTALFVSSYGLTRVLDDQSPVRDPWAPSPAKKGPSTQEVPLPAHLASRLTPREREIATLMLQAVPNYGIEEQLRLAPGTLKTHVSHIYQKLGVNSRPRLMLLALNPNSAEQEDSGESNHSAD